MDEISRIRVFVLAAESGSFSEAARRLGTTPSAVSRQVSNLEIELGARVFQRTTRKQSLTEVGALFLERARRIVDDVDQATNEAAMFSSAPTGVLHVTAEPDLATALLAPVARKFLDAHPGVRLRISMSAALVDLVEGGVDLAIRMGRLEDSSLIARRIAVSRSALYASPEYLERHGAPETPEDLRSHACLSFRNAPARTTWRFSVDERVTEVPVEGRVHASSLSFLRQLAVSGCGVAMLPDWASRDLAETGSLLPILRDYPIYPAETPISVVYAHNRDLAPKVRVFVDFLAASIR